MKKTEIASRDARNDGGIDGTTAANAPEEAEMVLRDCLGLGESEAA